MKKINSKFVYDGRGKKVGVVMNIKCFDSYISSLEDYQDYQLIKERRQKNEVLIPLEEVMEETLKRMKK